MKGGKMSTVAIDIGYQQVKAFDGKQALVFPSLIGLPEAVKYAENIIDGGRSEGMVVNMPDGPRFVGELAMRQARVAWGALDRQRPMADYLTLLYAALQALGVRGSVDLITGLPVSWYAKDKQAYYQLLDGSHNINGGLDIRALVTIQPFGSLFYCLFNDTGRLINPALAAGRNGVIDCGGLTTDLIVSDNGEFYNPGSDSTTAGLSEVYMLLAQKIESEYGHKMSMHEADLAIRAGQVHIRGRAVKLGDMVEPIARGVASSISAFTATLWEAVESGLDNIFITGGGAGLFGPYLCERFPHASILPDGHLCNVWGYHRYGLFKAKHTKKVSSNGHRG